MRDIMHLYSVKNLVEVDVVRIIKEELLSNIDLKNNCTKKHCLFGLFRLKCLQ